MRRPDLTRLRLSRRHLEVSREESGELGLPGGAVPPFVHALHEKPGREACVRVGRHAVDEGWHLLEKARGRVHELSPATLQLPGRVQFAEEEVSSRAETAERFGKRG